MEVFSLFPEDLEESDGVTAHQVDIYRNDLPVVPFALKQALLDVDDLPRRMAAIKTSDRLSPATALRLGEMSSRLDQSRDLLAAYDALA